MKPYYLITKKIKNQIFKKFQKKKLGVANCRHHDCVIFLYEIPCHVGSEKKIKWSKFERKKIYTVHAPRSGFLLFLSRTQYNVF
jgi:hypothetical protein